MTGRRNRLLVVLAGLLCTAGLALAGLYAHAGMYGVNALARRGATFWVSVTADDPRLSASMRLALREQPSSIAAGAFAWQPIDRGFEVGELPVMLGPWEVDRILLARIDPTRFRFVVRNAPAGDRDADEWLRQLGAALVINGSYYSPRGTPATPFLSAGVLSGPRDYDARHGAFVASAGTATIRDLANVPWPAAFRGADDAMVSYPLLLAPDGSNRVAADDRWLANRSFVGEDGSGNIILGTTADAFFSLNRLAAFLPMAPLGLVKALNLDGGPVACQAISIKAYRRDFCGKWELAAQDGQLRLLTWTFGPRPWALPNVLAVLGKESS